MALIVETGAGIRTANAYVSVAFVTAYLTALSRETENSWSTATTAQQEAAILAATQYIDTRWGQRFKGRLLVFFHGEFAQALLDFAGVPAEADTVTLGNQTYVFRTVLGTALERDEVLIGVDVQTSAQNLIDAITSNDERGTTYSEKLQPNRSASAAFQEDSTSQLILTALVPALAGNDIVLTKSAANITVTAAFVNGLDEAPQPLQFPRVNLFDTEGLPVLGAPLKLRQATAEYAVRARAAELYQDPVVNETGRAVVETFRKVGPIERRFKFQEGGSVSQLLRPYPAADRLLAGYVTPGGSAIR